MTYVQLGKYGDLLSVLPMMQNGDRLVVSRDYASVLDGVSYVEPVVYDGPWWEIHKAVGANPGSKPIQVNGENRYWKDETGKVVKEEKETDVTYRHANQNGAQTTSFQIESWHIAGKLAEWYKYPPLVFDKRDAAREQALLDQWTPRPRWNRKKSVLFFCGGETSPFPHKTLLRELVRLVFDRVGYGIIDLEQVKAHRIYDLLALYEQAHVLISTDSAPLHLARACPKLPVVALCNDKPLPWHGSAWAPNFIWYCRYGDFNERAHELPRILENAGTLINCIRPKIIWMANGFPEHHPDLWELCPVWPGSTGRDSHNTVGDNERHPYLKDVIRMGLSRAGVADRICITKPNTMLCEGTHQHVRISDLVYAYRIDQKNGVGTFAPIADLFCAPAPWWRDHLKEIPDLIMGRDVYWSQCLWAMFKKYGAYDATGMVYRIPPETKPEPPSTTPLPRVKHNYELCEAYVKTSGVTSRYPKVSEQVELIPLQTEKLFPFGYNPSIIEYKGQMLMAYRYHEGTKCSKLALATINEAGQVSSNKPLPATGICSEDPKLWLFDGEMFISWVESFFPVWMVCHVRYGQFVDGELMEIGRPKYGKNHEESMEKNWVFFERGQSNYFIYQSSPKQIIVKWNGLFEEQYETEGPKWPYGPVKGGARPVSFEGNLLRFFHSTLDNEYGNWHRRYYIGACVTKPEPPFEVLAISKKPIIYGSEIGPVKAKEGPIHFKGNVVFPGGVIERDWGWLLSLGVNDSACAVAKIKPEHLNL